MSLGSVLNKVEDADELLKLHDLTEADLYPNYLELQVGGK